ncbi:MAG: DinB family protein [Thermomicrobiales bacterium]
MREQLVDVLEGKGAHMTFDDAVADFPIDQINAKPPGVPYSFWHLIEHIRIAQWDILEFTRDPDHVSPEHPEGYWPDRDAETDAEGWQETIDRFHADLADVIEITRDLTLNLDAEIPHAAGYTYLREILLVADHNSYHTGELAILRQVMELWGDR